MLNNGQAALTMSVKDWLQAVSNIGFPIFLVLWLLGMIPTSRSPIDRVEASISGLVATINAHDVSGRDERREVLRVLRRICRNTSSAKDLSGCD